MITNVGIQGYAYHGDFMNGWDEKFLQQAVDTCKNNGPNGEDSGRVEDCKLFTLQSDEEAGKCTFKLPSKLVTEDCAGPRDGLCGGVPIQHGPGYANPLSAGQNDPAPAPPAPPAPTEVPVLTYKPGSIIVTNSDGGGGDITIAKLPTGAVGAAAAYPTIDSPVPSAANAAPSVPTVEAAAQPPDAQPPAAPATTAAPVVPANLPAPGNSIVSTMYYTSNGVAYEVVVEETEVTVTSTATEYQKKKRHLHHRRAGHHHGGLVL
jgi:hypothetical protein